MRSLARSRAHNLTGLAGSYTADLCFQLLGLSAFSLPLLSWLMAWKWIRSDAIQAATVKVFGAAVFFLSFSTALSIRPFWRPWNGAFSAGGVIGILIADTLQSSLNLMGTVLLTGICLILSLYLISRFSMAVFAKWLAGPLSFLAQNLSALGQLARRKNGPRSRACPISSGTARSQTSSRRAPCA